MSLLHHAAQQGDAAAVQFLLAAGAAVDAVGPFGASALWHAAVGVGRNNARTIRALLDAGASPTLATSAGMLPIHAAAMDRHTEALRILLNAAPATASATDDAGVTPLLAACRAGAHPEAVRLLLEAAPQAATMACATTNQLPIHVAAVSHNGGQAMQLLLQAAPQTATARDSDGRMPLHHAARVVRVASVRALLAADPAAACAVDSCGRMPLVEVLDILARQDNRSAANYIREVAFCIADCMPPAAALAVASGYPHAHACLPLFPHIATRHALDASQWQLVPTPCPGLAAALPAVFNRSTVEAALLVAHLPPSERHRLRIFALCLARTQRQLRLHLPGPLVGRILSLLGAACPFT